MIHISSSKDAEFHEANWTVKSSQVESSRVESKCISTIASKTTILRKPSSGGSLGGIKC